MKTQLRLPHYATLALSTLLAFSSVTAAEPTVLLNENIGFNVKGYKYEQSSFPCDIDKELVKSLVKRAKSEDFTIKAVNSHAEISNANAPLLAIDIESLSLGDKEHNYGHRVKDAVLPSVEVTAALIKSQTEGDYVMAKHSCAIANLAELAMNSSTNLMDLGTYGVTVCKATKICLDDLSKDIVQWVSPNL